AAGAQCREKYVDTDQLRTRLQSLVQQWPVLSERLRAQLLPAADVEKRLQVVGAITHPAQIGVDLERFRATYTRARLIRARYTLLDVLLEANLLDACVAARSAA